MNSLVLSGIVFNNNTQVHILSHYQLMANVPIDGTQKYVTAFMAFARSIKFIAVQSKKLPFGAALFTAALNNKALVGGF